MPDSIPSPASNQPGNPASEPVVTPVPKKRKKRRLLKIVGVLVLLLVLLVVFLPTIIGLGPVRSLVVSQAGNYINGRIEIQDWSFGWFSPIRISGVKVYDDKNIQVLEVAHFETQATLLKLARQNFDFGPTKADVDLTKVVVYHDGTTNLHKLIKRDPQPETPPTTPQPEQPSQPTEAPEIPDVKIDLTLALRGGIEVIDSLGKTTNIQLRQGTGGTLKIDDINQGITLDQKLIYDVNNANDNSTITIAGKADAVENNRLDIAKLSSNDLKLTLANVNLAAAQSFLAMAGQGDIKASGFANGQLAANLQPGQAGGLNGTITVSDLLLALPQLEDAYSAKTISIPVNVSRAMVDGKSRLKVDVKIQPPEAKVELLGDLPEDGLVNLGKQQMPGYDGWLTLTVSAKPDQVAAKFPKTLKVLEGARVEGGDIVTVIELTMAPQSLFAKTNTKLSVQGTRDGKAIAIKPINIYTEATAASVDPKKLVAGLRGIVFKFTSDSDFATIDLRGPSVAKLEGSGKANLDKLLAEVRQFSDVGATQLAGTMNFTLSSTENTAKPGDFAVKFFAAVNNLKVGLPQKQPIDLAYANVDVQSDLALDMTEYALKEVRTVNALVKAGESDQKLFLDLAANLSKLDLNKISAEFDIVRFHVNELATTQKKLIDPFVPTLKDQKIELAGGQVHFVGKGRITLPPMLDISPDVKGGDTTINIEQAQLSTPDLRIRKDGRDLLSDNFVVNIGGDVTQYAAGGLSAALNVLSVDSALVHLNKTDAPFTVALTPTAPRGSGVLTVKADMVGLTRLARELAPPPEPGAAPAAAPKVITSGELTGTLKLASDPQKNSTVGFNGKLAALSIEGTPVQKEDLTIDVNAAAASDPAKMKTADASATIKGQSLSLDAKNVSVNIPGKDTPVFKIMRTGHVEVALPDAAKAYAIAAALAPGLALPFEPTGGSLSVTLDVKDEGSKVDGNFTGTKLVLKNSKGQAYAFDPKQRMAVNFGADITAGEKLERVTVRTLNGNLIVAALEMPEKQQIVLEDPMGNIKPRGQIKLTGLIENVTPLLQFIQEADAPYPYRGSFTFIETVSSDKGITTLAGGGTINDFVVPSVDGKAAFTEKQIEIKNDLTVDPAKKAALIRGLTVNMTSSQAASLNVTGGIDDWEKQRLLRNIKVDINGSGEKLWAMLYPMLPPESQESYKDAKISGPLAVTLKVQGSYPSLTKTDPNTGKPENPLREVVAFGSATLPKFDALGLNGVPEPLPISLKRGMLYTADLSGDKPKFGTPWRVNEGALDLGSIAIDVASEEMFVSIGRKQQLLKGVQLNPVLASQVGSLASVLFADAKEASGAVDVMVMEFTKVPLADLTAGSKRARASLVYSVKNLRIDGPFPSGLTTLLQWGSQGIVGDIENGTLVLDKGIAYQDMVLKLVKTVEDRRAAGGERETRETLHFKGGIVLETQRFKDYYLTISQGLLLRDWRKGHPNGMTIELKGSVTDVQSILIGAATNIAVEGAKDKVIEKGMEGLEDLLNKKKK